MYFAYGWPRVANTGLPPDDTYIYLRATEKYLFAVSRTRVQLWTGGLYRIKLSECVRTDEDVKQEGMHIAALWSPAKAILAILTSENYLHLYAIHVWKDNLLHSSCNVALKDIQRADIYLKSSIRVDSETRALSITGDTRLLLVGFADGTVASLTWSGKMREVAYPLDDATELGFTEDEGGRVSSTSSVAAVLDPHQGRAAAAVGRTSGGGAGGGGDSAFAASATAAVSGNGQGYALGPAAAAAPSLISRAIVQMSYCEHSKQVVMVLADGACAVCSTSNGGLSPLPEMCFGRWLCGPQQQAVCAQVGARAQLIAVGRENGDVDLFRLDRATIGSEAGAVVPGGPAPGGIWEAPVRTLSLDSWGHKPQQMGPVAQLEWSPDARALAVGYAGQGVVVWSPSGCRLMCSLRQPPPGLSSLPSGASRGMMSHQASMASRGLTCSNHQASSNLNSSLLPQVPLDGPVSALCWGPRGYQLEVAEVGGGAAIAGAGGGLAEVTFAHSLPNNHRVARGGMGSSLADEEVHVLLAHDRLLLIREAGEVAMGWMPWASGDVTEPAVSQVPDLVVSHVQVPHSYVVANWPMQRSAISASGTDIAVAGRNGLAVYNRPTERWRLFGDISQERQVSCREVGWLSSGVLVACSGPDPHAPPQPSSSGIGGLVVGPGGAGGSAGVTSNELLLLPRYHLDLTSLLARYPLQQPPLAMDCLGSHILLASEPLEITLLEVTVHGELSPTGTPRATIASLREISMFDVGRHLSDVALVPLSPGAVAAAGTPAAAAAPRQCVLLRWGGMLSVLDLEKGSELALATEVEAFWLSDAITCQTGPFAGGLGTPPWAWDAGWSPTQLPGPSTASAADAAPEGASGPTCSSGTRTAEPESSGLDGGRSDNLVEAGSGVAAATADGDVSQSAPLHPGWLGSSAAASHSAATLDVEMPWWLFGPAGMQLCFPSSLGTAAPLSMACKEGHDMELEFDQEVYPVGISLADDAIVGVTQRITRGTGEPIVAPNGVLMASAAQLPCFHPIPESQPVLPCLLRRLLQRGAFQEAVSLTRRHARGPHFARSLEWLLFTALEIDTNSSSVSRPGASTASKRGGPNATASSDTGEVPPSTKLPHQAQPQQRSLLAAAADLVRHFPNLFAEVVVSVARKTDAALWPPLFDAVGSPSKLLDGLVEAGELASAACFLLIIDRLEGASAAQEQALRLMLSSLLRGQYPLCCELLRFVVPPSESDADNGRLLPTESTEGAGATSSPSKTPVASQQQEQSPAADEQSSDKPSTSAPGDSGSSGGAGGGAGRTWLGWLLGYSADPEPSTSEPQQTDDQKQRGEQQESHNSASADATKQQRQQHAESLAGSPDPEDGSLDASLADAARAQQAAGGSRVALPPSSTTGPSSFASPSNPALAQVLLGAVSGASGAEGSLDNARSACRLVAEHAWLLLESGHLAALGQLVQASSFLPGGLAGLMKQHRNLPYGTHICAECTAVELLRCLTRAVSELPVWRSEAVEKCAVEIEGLCREVGAVAWAVAMAVALVDAATVTAFKEEQPVVWAEFVQLLHADRSLSYLWEIVAVLTDGVDRAARVQEQVRARQGGEVATGVTTGLGMAAAAAAAASPFTLSGMFAASEGHVELRPMSVACTDNEFEESSQHSTPTRVIPGPSASEVSIARG